jgi:hypothetical protein
MVILRATSILGGQKVDKSMMCSITLVLMKAVPFYKKKRKKKRKKKGTISFPTLYYFSGKMLKMRLSSSLHHPLFLKKIDFY